VILTLINNITDQPGVITKRGTMQSLLLRPVDHVIFAKENPSYIGPGNSKNRLLQGFVRFASITQNNHLRDDTRSLLPRPVNYVAFAKENPSYQGPRNLKNWLLPRLYPVRVHHTKLIPSITSLLSASTPQYLLTA